MFIQQLAHSGFTAAPCWRRRLHQQYKNLAFVVNRAHRARTAAPAIFTPLIEG